MPEERDQSDKVKAEERGEFAEPLPAPSLGPVYAALLDSQVWQLDRADSSGAKPLHASPDSATTISQENADVSGSVAGNTVCCAAGAPSPVHQIVESLLFVGGGSLTAEQACAVVPGMTHVDFVRCLDALNRAYRLQGRPYRIRATNKAYEVVLRPKFLAAVEKMHGASREARLSSAALDVLSLVAYRQPLTKQEIDGMRGAESGAVLRQLVRRGLLTVVYSENEGKAEPVYRTTRRFVEFFQLRGLEDLPQTQDLQRL
jgi:segregation and condensation protein B